MSVADSALEGPDDAQGAKDLLDVLLAAGKLDTASARRARAVAASTNESIIAVLHRLALVDDDSVTAALSALTGLPVLAPSDIPGSAVALDNVNVGFLRRQFVLPIARGEDTIIVAFVDPSLGDGPAALSFAAGCAADKRLISFGAWRDAFAILYGDAPAANDGPNEALASAWTDDAARMRDHEEAAPAVRLVDALLDRAIEAGASDIHIEPTIDRVRVRLRVDGRLTTIAEEPADLGPAIAARVKILADMDVANRRAPQDGRTSLAARGRPIDVRISTIPSSFGESIALRLLRRDPALLNLDALGFSAPLNGMLDHVLAMRRGVFLITGPTGSGKTTTLYAMIERLRDKQLKILSIEDPIEYFFSDVIQAQVNEGAGLTFSSALRAFLRQDPDVILVGEIRDTETARIAVQAALTGHLVLSSLHTNDAASAVTRLVDMGLDRYLVSAALTGVMSQRLVPQSCTHCRRERALTPFEQAYFNEAVMTAPTTLLVPEGCQRCNHSGHSGRVALAEGFRVTDPIRAAINDPTGQALTQALRADNFASLRVDGARRAARGDVVLADVVGLADS